MASMSGFELKNIKDFVSLEGATVYQGDVYLNGEHMGFWSQDTHGGEDYLHLAEGITKEKLDKFLNENYPPVRYYESVFPYDTSFFFEDLTCLNEMEKQFKEWNEKEPTVLASESRPGLGKWKIRGFPLKLDNNDIVDLIKKENEEISEESTIHIFRSGNDFDIGEPIEKEVLIANELGESELEK